MSISITTEVLKTYMYDRRIVRYALDNDDANYKAFNVRKNQNGTIFDVRIRNSGQEIILHDFHTPFFGDHNIRNALSAIAMANELNISNDIVRTTISGFTGVGRRFTHVGNISGVKVIDDLTLVALTIMIAESKPEEKEMMVTIVMNCLIG